MHSGARPRLNRSFREGISPGRGFSHAKRAGVSFGFPGAENTSLCFKQTEILLSLLFLFYFCSFQNTGNRKQNNIDVAFFLFFFPVARRSYTDLSSFSLILSPPPPPLFPYILFRIAIRVANAVETSSITISSNAMHINFFVVVNESGRFRYRITYSYRKIFYLLELFFCLFQRNDVILKDLR